MAESRVRSRSKSDQGPVVGARQHHPHHHHQHETQSCSPSFSQCHNPAAEANWRRQVAVRRVKAMGPEIRNHFPSLRQRNEDGQESIVDIANSVGYPPYLLCRLFVEELLQIPRSKVSDCIKTPDTTIADVRLRVEVERCIMADQDFSPFVDRIANSLGKHYEHHLECLLRRLGLPFETEEDLREKGLPRTPDIRLLVPVGVTDQHGKEHVVSWIDSKAMFGDRETILSDVASQMTSYVNRFGPGMVIFWFGVESSLSSCGVAAPKDVLVVDSFPGTLTLPDGRVAARESTNRTKLAAAAPSSSTNTRTVVVPTGLERDK